MQKLIALAVVLIIAAASAPASAGGYYYRDGYRHRDHDRGAYLAGGLLLGLAAGAALADDRRDRRYYDGRYDRYDSYHDYRHYDGGWYYDRPYRREVVVYRSAPVRYRGPVRYGWHDRYYAPPPRYYDRYDRRRYYRGW